MPHRRIFAPSARARGLPSRDANKIGLLLSEILDDLRRLLFCLSCYGRRFALHHGALDVQVHGEFARFLKPPLPHCIQFLMDKLLDPARLHQELVALRLHSFPTLAQLGQHARVHCLAHLRRQLAVVKQVDEELRDII